MRLTYSFLFLVVFFLCQLKDLSAQNVGGGLVLGLNVSQVDGDFVGGFNQAGIAVGGYVYFELGERFRLQPEITFEQLGSATGGLRIVRLNYIGVPLLLGYSLPIGMPRSDQAVRFEAGPVFGVLLGAEDINGEIDFVNDLDVRISGGATYQSGRFGVGARFGYSVRSIVGERIGINILQPGVGGVYNHYITFSIRYRLFTPL